MILGALLFIGGILVAFLGGVAWPAMLVWALPAFILAILTLLGIGLVVNRRWNPAQRLIQPQTDDGWTVEQVQIPVTLVHLVETGQKAEQYIPATFLRPKEPLATQSAVLVICGAGDCRMSFKWHLFGELLAQGIAVLTIDPPGHGDFQQVPITRANALAAGRAALHWVRVRPGVTNVGICGISLGGCQAAALAAEDSTIRAIALISTPVELATLTRRTYLRETLTLFGLPRNIGLLRDGSLLTLWHEWRTLRGARYGESLYDMVRSFDACAAVRLIGSRPILIVHGSRDQAIPMRNARLLYEAASGEKELFVIRQANHVSPVLYPREMHQLAAWFGKWLNYNLPDA
jgi:esterase/lipase